MMMSDLIKRLRTERSVYDAELADEAANEIEQLRAGCDRLHGYIAEKDAEIERLRKDRLCRCADEVRCEMKAEIERLRKQKKVAVDALFSICQSDWGIGHSIAKPAHDAIKKLAAVEEQDDE
jgi:hypothetical protein